MAQANSTRDVVPGFGERVRALRTAAALSAAGLAERAGTHPTTVAKLERGERAPSFALALKIAAGLGVPVGDLAPPEKKSQKKGD